MKNKQLWKSYSDYTEKTSYLVRWFSSILFGFVYFETGEFNLTLAFISLIFIIDFFQYLVSAIIYRIFTRSKEKMFYKEHGSIEKDKEGNDLDYEAPPDLDTFAFICWVLKITLFLLVLGWVICAYIPNVCGF